MTDKISIHAPLAGRDLPAAFSAGRDELFQSTRPLRGATAGSAEAHRPSVDFNPRAPCGARLKAAAKANGTTPFQSTRPLRGATVRAKLQKKKENISIHAPLAGRDPFAAGGDLLLRISIHAPLAGRDWYRRGGS